MRRGAAGARRGLSLAGLVLLVLIMAGAGMGIAYFARHADRSAHWFQHSQVAYDLADSALKQALFVLARRNGKAAAAEPGPGDTAASAVFERLVSGQAAAGAIPLFDSREPAGLPPAIKAELAALSPEYSPELAVTLEVVESEPHWPGLLLGIPLLAGERRGAVRFTATAAVKTPVGVRVDRTLTLEKGFRVVSILPPLLGRFTLFLAPRAALEPNVFRARFDDATGDSVAEASSPLILRNGFTYPVVAPGTRTLDRTGLRAAIPDPKFLDRQGWVYLGPAEGGTSPWILKLTHGYGKAGETPLLAGERLMTQFKGSQSEDTAFRKRFDDAFKQNATEGCQTSLETEQSGREGLMHFVHGWATNYELIGMDPINYEVVQNGGARAAPQLGGGESSVLRLYGTPDAFSPTLVFGPVVASVIRRAAMQALVGPEAFCPNAGMFTLNLFRMPEHPARFQPVVQAAFGAAYDDWGTNKVDGAFAERLDAALDPSGNGEYAPDGVLDRRPGGAAAGAGLASDHFPWASSIGSPDGIPDAEIVKLLDGRIESDKVYVGTLSEGFSAFRAALMSKLTYTLRPEAYEKRMLSEDRKSLEVPGIAMISGGARGETLALPPGVTVKRGGILLSPGPIEIQGDIKRGGPGEPLTLVSMRGDITVRAAAKTVEAVLVAPRGRVEFEGSGVTVSGGVACRGLDFEKIRAMPEPLVLEHAPESDPTGPQAAASLRVYYGGEDRLVVSGSLP